MRIVDRKADCSGCAACMSACKHHAIKMEADKKGFLYPKIDASQCVDCGQCKKVCPAKTPRGGVKEKPYSGLAYAVRNKDEAVRQRSSSGGVFYEIAKDTLGCGGAVYGAVFDEDFRVVHVRGAHTKDVRKMQGSKYVQSNTEGIFEAVKNDLAEGRMVLFTGCPCQVDGLKRYLGKARQERLITCDLVCLGVNSPKVWQDYLRYVADKERITKIRFRDKSLGWRNSVIYIQTDKKSYAESSGYDYFYQAFSGHMILRDSCYQCRYANLGRKGDITIGDFWGIENVCPQMDDDQGVSLVLLNSAKGREVFGRIANALIVKKVQIGEVMQPALKHPAKYQEKYESFWEDYLKYGFPFVCRKYLNGGMKGKMKKWVKKGLIKMHIWDYLKR